MWRVTKSGDTESFGKKKNVTLNLLKCRFVLQSVTTLGRQVALFSGFTLVDERCDLFLCCS